MEPNFWNDLRSADGIKLPQEIPGSHKIICPECGGKGSKGHEGKTLSVTVDDKGVVWYCNRQNNCGHTGSRLFTKPEEAWRQVKQKKVYRKPPEPAKPDGGLDDRIYGWFKKRGISSETVDAHKIFHQDRGFGSEQKRWVAFPYHNLESQLTNVKYRTLKEKRFTQEKDAEQTFYGLSMVPDDEGKTLYIVEGEMDKLAMYEAGYQHCVSVPAGGISEKSIGKLADDSDKFMFIQHAGAWLDRFEHFVLACDFDDVGKALMEEVSRRLGREKCWRVHWPKGEDGAYMKDANDVLIVQGVDGLIAAVEAAEPWPIHDIHSVTDYASEVWKLYRGEYDKPLSTGFRNLDQHMRIRPGEISVVTGIPNSGKSEMMDAIMLNMISLHGWKFGICSFENAPRFHIAKLAEKIIGAPFFNQQAPVPRASETDVQNAMVYLNDNVQFIRADDPDKRPPSIDWIIGRAKAMVRQFGLRGLVIDPYNEIESTRGNNMSETEFISYLLSKIKRFAQTYDVHVWIVAHPRKMNAIDGVTPIPGLYDIGGSAHWANKADLGWCVSRDRADTSKPTELHVLKVRFKECGSAGGIANFSWDKWSGRYSAFMEESPQVYRKAYADG